MSEPTQPPGNNEPAAPADQPRAEPGFEPPGSAQPAPGGYPSPPPPPPPPPSPPPAPTQAGYGGYGAAPAYPGGGSAQPPAAIEPPPPIQNAVKLMYVGAALSVLGILLGLAQQGSIRDAIIKAQPKLTSSEVDAAVSVSVVSIIVIALIAAGLWILNARFNARGRNWARILSTVLGGLAVLSFLASLAQPQDALNRIVSLVQVALAAVILWLLWRPESSEFYRASNAPRY